MQIMVLSRKCFKESTKAENRPANLPCGAVLMPTQWYCRSLYNQWVAHEIWGILIFSMPLLERVLISPLVRAVLEYSIGLHINSPLLCSWLLLGNIGNITPKNSVSHENALQCLNACSQELAYLQLWRFLPSRWSDGWHQDGICIYKYFPISKVPEHFL